MRGGGELEIAVAVYELTVTEFAMQQGNHQSN